VLSVPEGVDVRKVDLSIELQILAFHAQRRSVARPGRPRGARPQAVNGRPGPAGQELTAQG
jgi:redox-sensing transcriptional repressor